MRSAIAREHGLCTKSLNGAEPKKLRLPKKNAVSAIIKQYYEREKERAATITQLKNELRDALFAAQEADKRMREYADKARKLETIVTNTAPSTTKGFAEAIARGYMEYGGDKVRDADELAYIARHTGKLLSVAGFNGKFVELAPKLVAVICESDLDAKARHELVEVVDFANRLYYTAHQEDYYCDVLASIAERTAEALEKDSISVNAELLANT